MHFPDLQGYLRDLSLNNERAWFMLNKPRYDILRLEFVEFTTDLIRELSRHDPDILSVNAKKALFRINRDVRFSNDKSPYKTVFSAAIVPGDRKKPSDGGGPAYYFQFDGNGRLFYACGEYIPPADRLKSIRTHIVEDSSGFKRVLRDKKLKDQFGELQEEGKLQRPPKAFPADHELVEYLKLKSIMVWTEIDYRGMDKTDIIKHLTAAFKSAYPLVKWLRAVPTHFSESD